MSKPFRSFLITSLAITLGLSSSKDGKALIRSGDAYVIAKGTAWSLGTARAEKTVALENGRFTLTSFKNKTRGRDYVQGPSNEFRFNWNGSERSGADPVWSLADVKTATLAQGEIELTIRLRGPDVAVAKRYVVYPGESLIQESLIITNLLPAAGTLGEPSFLQAKLFQREVEDVDFSYMTGGATFSGCWMLKTIPLTKTWARNFDASDVPECLPGTRCEPYGPNHFLGSTAYAPITVFFNRKTHDGVFVGWDYLGRWASRIGAYDQGPVNVGYRLEKFVHRLPAGESLETPMGFMGVFDTDLDEMGNQLLDYQYRYKWDYTRADYFPAIQMLGYWWNGTADWDSRVLKNKQRPTVDFDSSFRKVFRTADLMRYVGADIYWRDYGWWDKPGDWNGPDFNETRRYLDKYGMKQSIYTIAYQAEHGSKVIENHPDWGVFIGGTFAGDYYLNMAKPEVTNFILNDILERQQREWGDFQWRNDALPFRPIHGDPTPMLFQERNYDRMLKTWLDRHPGSSYQGCLAGGHGMNYENLRMAVAWQMTESTVGGLQNYYTSYLFPPDKTMNMPDTHDPDKYDKKTWRNLLWNNFCLTGDTYDPDKLEGLRTMIDIYHYLYKEGVVGRWVKVYHPAVTGDKPDRYLQRVSGDSRKGVIIPAHALKTPIVVFPKGLLPDLTYHVSFQESKAGFDRKGVDLMKAGIRLETTEDGEIIYFNLPLHPGSTADKVPPRAPGSAGKAIATNMGYAGVEVRWAPGEDDNWISYYEVFRNGHPIDKVAKGLYYFDHSAGATLEARYEVRTVDGAGNVSPLKAALGGSQDRVQVLDDGDDRLAYIGPEWKHEKAVRSVFGETQSSCRNAGNAVELKFDGSRITWFGRLGASMGKADVYIDGELDRTVDTFDADEIVNVPVYARTFSARGSHALKIAVRGDHHAYSLDSWIYVDGIQVGESEPRVVEDSELSQIRYGGSGWKHTQNWRRQSYPVADKAQVLASGESLSYTDQPADSAELTFEGDGVTLVGKLCPGCGKLDVWIDGRVETTLDTYAPDVQYLRPVLQGGWQAPIFRRAWTERGTHTVRLVVREDRNRLSEGRRVYLDAFQITGGGGGSTAAGVVK